MNEAMEFPETWEEFEKQYGFTDDKETYTNGARLIPSFRVKQWLEQEPKTGHWITTPRKTQLFDWIDFGDEEKTYYITCSECGYQFTSISKITNFRFCPNCGCAMFVPQESEIDNERFPFT